MGDPKAYANFIMITLELFKETVETLTPYLLKHTTFIREPLDVGLKLAMTFHFIANGNFHANMQYSSNMSRQKHNLKMYSWKCAKQPLTHTRTKCKYAQILDINDYYVYYIALQCNNVFTDTF